jgi:transcriptional regulator with XRE-family HTH domain
MLTDLKRMRLVCELRQIDVAAGTGVSIAALSSAERGREALNHSEHAIVVSFLQRRWRALQEFEGHGKVPVDANNLVCQFVGAGL